MRLVWITILALICGGVLIATKASTGKSASVAELPVASSAVASLQAVDTLTKTDKLSVAYVQEAIVDHDAPPDPTPVIGPTPVDDPSPAEVSSPPTNTTELSKQASRLYAKQKKPTNTAKLKNAAKSKKHEFARHRAVPTQRVCAHANYGLDGILVALKLKTHCVT
ncbi:MAG: hypothetical protein JWQ89_1236 [Devosia sp.]|uniref:hypothetical protein n=1 Tax=Devosia sp. TaxID=1871048 RepID=UPI00260B22E7|nr:hypothetical protein [Devosia sp.]MDB5539509.1 hypothetical protein [Devosia sp.]